MEVKFSKEKYLISVVKSVFITFSKVISMATPSISKETVVMIE